MASESRVLLCGYWELNSGPSEVQAVLLTVDPSLQPLGCYFLTSRNAAMSMSVRPLLFCFQIELHSGVQVGHGLGSPLVSASSVLGLQVCATHFAVNMFMCRHLSSFLFIVQLSVGLLHLTVTLFNPLNLSYCLQSS